LIFLKPAVNRLLSDPWEFPWRLNRLDREGRIFEAHYSLGQMNKLLESLKLGSSFDPKVSVT